MFRILWQFCAFFVLAYIILFLHGLLLLSLVSSVPSQEIGWEEHLQNDLCVSSGTLDLNSVNQLICSFSCWQMCLMVYCASCCRGHEAAVLCVQFDNEKIISGSCDKTIKVVYILLLSFLLRIRLNLVKSSLLADNVRSMLPQRSKRGTCWRCIRRWQTMKHMHHLWFWLTCSIMWKHDVLQKTTSTKHNILHCCQMIMQKSRLNLDMWLLRYASTQTDRHKTCWSQYFAHLPG